MEFRNSKYEYQTLEVPFESRAVSHSFDDKIKELGWTRVWADVTLEGIFIVYRRERKC